MSSSDSLLLYCCRKCAWILKACVVTFAFQLQCANLLMLASLTSRLYSQLGSLYPEPLPRAREMALRRCLVQGHSFPVAFPDSDSQPFTSLSPESVCITHYLEVVCMMMHRAGHLGFESDNQCQIVFSLFSIIPQC